MRQRLLKGIKCMKSCRKGKPHKSVLYVIDGMVLVLGVSDE